MSRPTDSSFYQQLVHRHATDLYRYARRCTGESDAAEDIVQDTFVEAWRSLHTLRDLERSRAWLFQILRHRYYRWLQHKTQHPVSSPSPHPPNVIQLSHYDPRPQIEGKDLLQAGLNTLKQRFKEPFLMVFLLGMTCEEAAEALDLPVGTVLSRLHRAKQRLRTYFTEQGDTDLLDLGAHASPDAISSILRHPDKKAER